jgi:hypothetical protein
MARLLRFAIAAATSIALLFLLTYGSYALGLLAGGPTTRRYIVWSSFLLPVFLGLCAALWPSPTLKRSVLAAGGAGAGFGLVYIYLATRVLFWVVFRRWGGFGHSVWLSPIGWVDLGPFAFAIAAGACAMLLAITSRSRKALLTVAVLVIVAAIAPGSVFNFITHNQELTIAVVTPLSTAAPISPEVGERIDISHIDVGRVTSHVLHSLSEAGVTGKYQVFGVYRQGHGKQVLAIIVFNQPVVTEIDLHEPRGADVIYVQESDGWRKIPSQVPTLDRSISLRPPIGGDEFAFLMIHDADGEGHGFGVLKPSN